MIGLKKIREKNGKTQKEVAENLHVTVNTVSRWESGVMQPRLSRVVEIARYFGVSIDELMSPPNFAPQSEAEKGESNNG